MDRVRYFCLGGPRLTGLPCELNGKPPQFIVEIYRGDRYGEDIQLAPHVKFDLYGERTGKDFRVSVLARNLDEAHRNLEGYRRMMNTLWDTFCTQASLCSEE